MIPLNFSRFDAAVQGMAREEYPLPPLVEKCLSHVHQLHVTMRIYRRIAIARREAAKGRCGHADMYGGAIQIVCDTSDWGSRALSALLLAKCAQDALEGYRRLYAATQDLYSALRNDFPRDGLEDCTILNEELLSSPFAARLKGQFRQWVQQALRILECVKEIFVQILSLSMRLCDAKLIAKGDPMMRQEASAELVAELDLYLSDLKNNMKRLAEELEKGSALADKMLVSLGSEKKSQEIINALNAQMAQVAEASHVSGHEMIRLAGNAMSALYSPGKITALGMPELSSPQREPSLKPSRYPPWGGSRADFLKMDVPSTPKRGSSKDDDVYPPGQAFLSPLKRLWTPSPQRDMPP